MIEQHALVESFPAIVSPDAKILILGSMPGVQSLAASQYYAHPRNSFWPIMGALFAAHPELPYKQRCERLREAGVALWDVLSQCQRPGSLDSRIDRQSEIANDIPHLLARAKGVSRIAFNGKTAEAAFNRHVKTQLPAGRLAQIEFVLLPSTSPAHASRSYAEKLQAWRAGLLLRVAGTHSQPRMAV